MLAALAYAFSTYNPVIIAAGHDTQMQATALMPLILAGLISIYEKKYWLGFALTTYAAYQQIGVNHLQVTYYFFIIAALVTIAYLVKWIQEKDWKHIGIAGGITIVSAIIALAGNALILKTTSEYAKFTMRGGKDITIEASLYQAVAENMASEQSARMVAMKAASDNAKDVIGELKLVYNKARQASITKELSEIVSGAAAV